MRFNYRTIMLQAWKIFRKIGCTFSEALRRSWKTAKAAEENVDRIRKAKDAAGVAEEARTWYGWTLTGREVIHEVKALFQAVVIDGSTKSGTRVLSFFGLSQTQEAAPITA